MNMEIQSDFHPIVTYNFWWRCSAQFGMDEEWDPYRMTEGISDDPVEAAVLGMRNLRVATDSLMAWVLEPGDDHYELEAHYLQNLTQPG